MYNKFKLVKQALTVLLISIFFSNTMNRKKNEGYNINI